MKKTFVLDTNVLLHDPSSIFNFDEHNIVIPILVLEELDKFKKGNDWVNQNARSFVRILSELSDATDNKIDISLGEGKGSLSIPIEGYNATSLSAPIFLTQTIDNQLLSLCLNLKETVPNLIFVTKDINLRMKARAINLEAQDYENDKVEDPATASPGYNLVTCPDSLDFSEIYVSDIVLEYTLADLIPNPIINEYYILRNGGLSAILRYSKGHQYIRVKDQNVCGIAHKNLEQRLAIDALLNKDIPLVALTGISGSGKTLLSLAAAIQQKRNYVQIYLARPIVPLGNDIGFLPGSIEDKLDPYMQPLYDNLEVIKKESGAEKVILEMQAQEKIKIIALPYLRGRSLPRVFFIIDEAQNLTPLEVKTIVTRAGEGAKFVFTGDVNQIDSPYMDQRSNGLSHLIHKMKGQELFAHIKFSKGERSKLSELASEIL